VGPEAHLIDDHGASASSDEFFRSRAFLDAEGVTHTLRVESAGGAIRLPVIVRETPGGGALDATSPYGYPGAEGEAPQVAPGDVDWSPTGLVTVFVRDRIGEPPCFSGATERGRVQVVDPAAPPGVRKTYRNEIRRNRRLGYVTERLIGPDVADPDLDAFLRLYTETMERAGAATHYFFDRDYFRTLLGSDRCWLLVTRAPDRRAAAAAVATLSDGTLHYFLSGSGDEFREHSPTKSTISELIEMASELALPLNLGGGATPGDGLESFKRGFANAEAAFHTHEIVCDRDAYRELSAGSEPGGFFPAYRAGMQ
jgi:hypothetical protein